LSYPTSFFKPHFLIRFGLFVILPVVFFIVIVSCNNIDIKEGIKNDAILSSKPSPISSLTKYVGGIQINETDQVQWAKELGATGMNTAQVTAYAKQGVWNSDHIWWEKEDSANVIREIRAIKYHHIHVILVLSVALQHEYEGNPFKWHGMIFPKTKQQKKEWFSRYNYWVEMWSKICEREGVEILAIGSELNALTSTVLIDSLPPILEYFSNEKSQKNHELKILNYQKQLESKNIWEYGTPIDKNHKKHILSKIKSNLDWSTQVSHTSDSNYIDLINTDRIFLDSCWRVIIHNVRKLYKGKLTLAANFDNYNEVNFWDELDFIGINAYFPLRKIESKPITDSLLSTKLIKGWGKVFKAINLFKINQKIIDKPLFFTELGYTKKENCTTAPWQGYGYSLLSNDNFDTLLIWQDVANNLNERKLAVDALHKVVQQDSIPLEGISYWKLSTHDYHEEHEAYMLHLSKNITDSLQVALSQFLTSKTHIEKN